MNPLVFSRIGRLSLADSMPLRKITSYDEVKQLQASSDAKKLIVLFFWSDWSAPSKEVRERRRVF